MPLYVQKVTGLGNITIDNGILKCRSTRKGDVAYAYFPLYLTGQEYVEVSFEARVHTGVTPEADAGGIGYNYYDKEQTIDGISGPSTDVTYITSTDWKPYRITVTPNLTKPFTALMFGCFSNTVAELWFRNMDIRVYNAPAPNPDIRMGRVVKNSSGWWIENRPNERCNIGMQSVTVGAWYIRVNFDPINSWCFPIATATLEANNTDRQGWHVQLGAVGRDFVDIMFFNKSNNLVVPSAMTSDTALHLIVMGV